jgi:predicted nucleotidyltransferase
MTDSLITGTPQFILNQLAQHRAYLRKLGVQTLGLFGSYVRDEACPESDLDFVFTMQDMSFTKWMDLWNFLEDTFGLTVDLVPEKDLREEIRIQVLSEVIYIADL